MKQVMEGLPMELVSLVDVFASLPDPRDRSGLRHPLSAILTHATVAMLAGARSLEAIAQFGRDRGEAFAKALGYVHPKLPCKATFHNVFKSMGASAFEKALTCWLTQRVDAGWKKLSIDGKTLCGTTGEQLPGVHLLAAFAHEAKSALAQMSVDAKTNEHKAALELLDMVGVKDKLIMGDAMFCQRELSKKVLEKKGIISGMSKTTSRNSSSRFCS
jgi:hypothetical protein